MTEVPITGEIKSNLTAAFLGIKFIPLPFVAGVNNLNPKLILRNTDIECRALFVTKKASYSEIDHVDIFLAYKTNNLKFSGTILFLPLSATLFIRQTLELCLNFYTEKKSHWEQRHSLF